MYFVAKPRNCKGDRLLLYEQFLNTLALRTSVRMAIVASSVNSGNGSETAIGETPVSSGSCRSAIL